MLHTTNFLPKQAYLIFVAKMVVEESAQLEVLSCNVGEIDEESRAHVTFQFATVLRCLVSTGHQMTVLEQASSSDFFRRTSINQALVKMSQGLGKVAKHALGNDSWSVTFDIQILNVQQRVQCDLEGVNAEFELTAHFVDEFELDTPETRG